MVENLQLWKSNAPELREYQESIYKRAKTDNILVVIPTGLGKTYIAAKLSAYILQLSPRTKIIFMAPTRPLINQHIESLEKVIDLREGEFCVLSGKIPPAKRKAFYDQSGPMLIFATPQTIKNDIDHDRINLLEVSLMIFDEAHRASGNYAYCIIADIYDKIHPKPHILALTASPGSSKEKIENVVQNLHIPLDNIEYRDKTSKEVAKYTFHTEIIQISVKMNETMQKIYEVLDQIKEETLLNYIQNLVQFDPSCPTDPDYFYLSTILKFQKRLSFALNQNGGNHDMKLVRTLLSISARAMKIFHLVDYCEAQGLAVVFKAMEKTITKLKEGKGSFADKYLYGDPRIMRIFQYLNQQFQISEKNTACDNLLHPKMIKLREVILSSLERDPSSRILIFTKLRNTVQMLVKFLKTTPLIQVKKFVGQSHKSKKDRGMNQKEQIQVLDQFREGKYNTIVATNVAEEGLDIAECNTVIFYDNSASEIRFIQRMGRTGRSKEGSVIILYTKGTSDERFLNIAKFKHSSMKKNLEKPIIFHQKYNKVPQVTNKTLPTSAKIVYMDPNKKELYNLGTVFTPRFNIVKSPKENHFDIYIPSRKIAIDITDVKNFALSFNSLSFRRSLLHKIHVLNRYICYIDISQSTPKETLQIARKIPQIAQMMDISIHLFKNSKSLCAKMDQIFA